ADAPDGGQPALGRDDDAGLALDGLEEEPDGVRPDGGLEGGGVAVLHLLEPRRGGPEAAVGVGIGREPDDGGGAPVEVVLADQYLSLARDPFFSVAPQPHGLDGGLDRL